MALHLLRGVIFIVVPHQFGERGIGAFDVFAGQLFQFSQQYRARIFGRRRDGEALRAFHLADQLEQQFDRARVGLRSASMSAPASITTFLGSANSACSVPARASRIAILRPCSG